MTAAEDILQHHGILGMKWGVRKDLSIGSNRSARNSNNSSQSKEDQEYSANAARIQADLAKHRISSKSLEAKYGSKNFHLTDRQKKALIYGGAAAAILGLVYLDEKHGAGLLDKTSRLAYAQGVDGLRLNFDKGVELKAGTILRRISATAETEVRPDGFFAAHRPEDVESYKAILPTFWDQWGVGSARHGGFVNEYTAKAAIRAPSGKESLSVFKDLMKSNKDFAHAINGDSIGAYSSEETFKQFAQIWAVGNGYPAVGTYFDEIKSRGYNAVIDFNDAGILGKQPLRVLDGNAFSITKSVPLPYSEIKEAAKNWEPELVHMEVIMKRDESSEDTLQHYGILGMKWGVRRDLSVSSTETRNRKRAKPATDVTAKQKPGHFVKTAGGTKQVATEDAIRSASARQLAKRSTTDSLSNKQLQDTVNRMNLEQQYHTLSKKSDRRTRGARFIQSLLGIKHPSQQGKGKGNGGGSNAGSTMAIGKLVGEAIKKNKSK